MTTPTVHLRPGTVQPVFLGHPWIFAQAIARIEGTPSAGDEVRVADPRGNILGRGFYSPGSAIPVRILSREDTELSEGWLSERINAACAWRRELLGLPSELTDGYRWINSEGDGLSGLVVDRFADSLVIQLSTLGMKRRQESIINALVGHSGVSRVYEAASARVQKLEGFEVSAGLVRGEISPCLNFRESGFSYELPVPGSLGGGQKTGYYFDQRENRARVESLSRGRRVLDLCSYVGGFSLAAARGGAASVLAIDSSQTALAACAEGALRAGFGATITQARGDVRKTLGAMARASFDLAVLDPPKLAQHARELGEALGLYRRLNAAAARMLAPGGILVTCSCSGAVSPEDFLRAVVAGLRDAGRDTVVLELRGAAMDHPSPGAFSEGRYLKCVIARLS